ncbi:MAG: nuclear transport factor 2 family protein [Acidimicrobiales bacterium]
MASAQGWVTDFLERSEGGLNIDRVTDVAPGMDADGMLAILGDERLGAQVIEAMTDLMHPTDSMYYDAIFGAFHGQVAIRNWLVPVMGEISFIEFAATAPSEVFTRDGGTSSIDEWQMWANIGEERLPLPRGISTRHYEGGWVVWNADVYDTGAMRQPPPDAGEAPPLPEVPRTPWVSEPMAGAPRSDALQEWLDTPGDQRGPLDHADIHTIMITPELGLDVDAVGPLFHPIESRLIEPAAEFVGQDTIREHLSSRRENRTALKLEQVGPPLFNGSCTTFEWLASDPKEDSPPIRGASVCRYRDGMIVYAADYYDTAEAS